MKNQMDYLNEDPDNYLITFKTFLSKSALYKYQAIGTYYYYSKRYNRWVKVSDGDLSDGATGTWDIKSNAWWFHDRVCADGSFLDGSLLSNWMASTIVGDILYAEGMWYLKHKHYKKAVWRLGQSVYWWFATFFMGGGQARKNGLFRVKSSLDKNYS